LLLLSELAELAVIDDGLVLLARAAQPVHLCDQPLHLLLVLAIAFHKLLIFLLVLFQLQFHLLATGDLCLELFVLVAELA